MITIGIVLGGPEQDGSSINVLLSTVGLAAAEARGDFAFGTEPAVNVVFDVAGSLYRPDWEGLRDGRFSRKEKMLMVQVAVSEEDVSRGIDLDYVIELLHGANAIAFDVFGSRGIKYPLRKAEALVEKIRQIAARDLS